MQGCFCGSWPVLTGLALGVWIWILGCDNFGVFVIVFGFVLQAVWVYRLEKNDRGGSSYNPMSGEIKITTKVEMLLDTKIKINGEGMVGCCTQCRSLS